MALNQTTGWLILAAALAVHAAEFPVQHQHWRKACAGTMTVDAAGIRFSGAPGHAWNWKLEDIRQLALAPDSIHIVTYEVAQTLVCVRDRSYTFTGRIPAAELAAFLAPRMDRRLVLELAEPAADAWSIPVRQLSRNGGSQGSLAFGSDSVTYLTPARDQSRTWRYADIRTISSADDFELSIVTRERDFHFQLKQPIDEARYNQLWLQIEQKNRRIEP